MTAWTLARARHTYSVPFWSEGYFDINDNGEMCVLPQGPQGPSLPLPGLVEECRAAGSEYAKDMSAYLENWLAREETGKAL